MKKESGLHKINEENEYDDQMASRAGPDGGSGSELEKRRNHRQPKIRNDVFKSKDRQSVDNHVNDYKS